MYVYVYMCVCVCLLHANTHTHTHRCTFDVESDTFELGTILDAPLLANQEDIEDICIAAVKERDIDIKLKAVMAGIHTHTHTCICTIECHTHIHTHIQTSAHTGLCRMCASRCSGTERNCCSTADRLRDSSP